MANEREMLSGKDIGWINSQKIFFVATAPSGRNGHVNCSPKGGDCFKLISESEFIYADYTGSGVETIAHVMENRRICIMFCAFEGPPRIIRLYGAGEVITENNPEFQQYLELFPKRTGTRAFIRVNISRIAHSCGYQVPYFQYQGERDALKKWEDHKGEVELRAFRKDKNSTSIDGLDVPFFG